MAWEAWFTIGVIVLMIVGLARNLAPADVILVGGLTLLMTASYFSDGKLPGPAQAVAGFGNEGLITVGVLFIVVTGLTQTGAMSLLTQPLLGRPRNTFDAQVRMMLPVCGMSAFLNNTPIVAAFMPVVSDWARKVGLAPSRLFIPLSYAAILGGTCTLIGTSTNLVINGMLVADDDTQGLGLFAIAWVGLPCAVVGLGYILLASRWLLPDRKPAISLSDDPRQYTVEMLVEPGSALEGQTIEKAGLRHLPGLYLAEIERAGEVLPAVGPQVKLQGNDRLVFVGVLESVVDLRKTRGLTPATNQVFKLDAPQSTRCLIEAVVSNTCPVVGKSIREGRFRSQYNAAVIAVARSGERINRKIGDIVLQAGDVLLLEASPAFAEQQRHSRDFYLVSRVEGSNPPRHDRAWIALVILAAMVIVSSLGILSILVAALLAAGLMVLSRCCTASTARRSLDWQVLIVIGAAFGIGRALDTSGAAAAIASQLMQLAGDHPTAALAITYLVTMTFTAFITNNAAAVLMFPIAKAYALSLGSDVTPFAIVIMMAASAEFSTPIGYQTNLMVYGPGGYRFTDYVRFGLPLNGLMLLITLLVVPQIWPM